MEENDEFLDRISRAINSIQGLIEIESKYVIDKKDFSTFNRLRGKKEGFEIARQYYLELKEDGLI